MRIAFLNPSGQLGGAERSLLDVFAGLRAAEPEWELSLVASADGPLVGRAAALGVRTVVLPFPAAVAQLGDARGSSALLTLLRASPAAVRYAGRLRDVLREIGPDVVHSNGFKMHVLGLWARSRGTPVVWHVHDFVGRRPVMSELLRLHAGRCDAVIANSLSVADDVNAVCRGRVPVHPVYNAVDLEVFSPEGPVLDLDAASGIPAAAPGTVRVGLVATLGWWKGHETFFQALRSLPPELPVRGYVVGGALYETSGSQHTLEQLRLRAAELGLADRVGFTGFLEDAAPAMRALDVVVHASIEPEAFGLVIVEAMACGRSLVMSEAGGAAELVTAGVDALGHRPGDAAGLARQIEVLVRDAELRDRLGRAGRATAEARFDRGELAAKLVPIYRSVAESKG